MNKEQENAKCDPCERKFEENVHELVNEVEGYTDKDRRNKEKEVEDAFAASETEPKRRALPPSAARDGAGVPFLDVQSAARNRTRNLCA